MQRVTLKDIRLPELTLESLPRLATLRRLGFERRPEICIERARYVTEYLRSLDDPHDGPEVRQAKKIAHYLRHRAAVLHDGNLLPGGTTSKALGAPLFPEFFALTLWPELDTVSRRAANPQGLTPGEARELNTEIFPFWMDRNVLEVARRRGEAPEGLSLFEGIAFFIAGKAGCISHTVPAFQAALERGLLAVIEDAKERLAALGPDADPRRLDFYRAVPIVLQGLLDYAAHLAEHCEALSREAKDPVERKELAEMAAVCRWVPARPARTFREAVSALWLCHAGILAENINMAMSPGRLDQVLWPYYARDVEAGLLDPARALELVGCLWLKLSDNVDMAPEASEKLFGGAGSVPAVTLGGVGPDGEDAVNDLTYVMLRATELLRTRDPNVNARYEPGKNTPAYRDRVAEVVVTTKAVPALFNDLANVDALRGQGETEEHARDYAVIGCVELCSAGREYSASSSILLNLTAPLEMALYRGKRPLTGDEQIGPVTRDPLTMTSAAELWEAFTTQLDWLIGHAVELNDALGRVHQDLMPSPLLSCFIEGPMDKGLDVIQGGATYNSSGATHVGFANVVDSLNAVEQLVFTEHRLTMAELLGALRKNFAGAAGTRVRRMLQTRGPKYGTEHPVALKNSRALIDHLYGVYQAHTSYRGGPYRPAYWTMTNHAGLGLVCGALPDGRGKEEVFASGITPESGAVQSLPECLGAVASLGGRHVPGGWALNLKFTPEKDEAAMARRLGATVEGYFHQGGQQVQFNVMTYQQLLDARAHPERYPELMVRVSGYSAYFKDLNERMKDELITRTQYDLGSGRAVPFPVTAGAAVPETAPASRPATAESVPAALLALHDGQILLETLWARFKTALEGEAAEEILKALLLFMQLVFRLDPGYRKNIRGFRGRYQFLSKDHTVTMAAIFDHNRLLVREAEIDHPDLTVRFASGRALLSFLLRGETDVIGPLLTHDIEPEGNLNYLYRFAYLAARLRAMAGV